MITMFADKPQYRQYARMLVDLHALIATGKGNSEEANSLREQMELPEAHLSELPTSAHPFKIPSKSTLFPKC